MLFLLYQILIAKTEIFIKNKFKKIRIDKRFKSSRNTICNIINNKTKIKCLQLEISKKYRNLNQIDYFKVLVNTLIDCIKYMERRDKMNEINYIEKYDEILDIKPSYGYKRELGVEPKRIYITAVQTSCSSCPPQWERRWQ